MDFMVLGPLQVRGAGGDRIRLASDAQRRLVSVFVLNADEVVRSEELEDLLGLSPSALRTSVCRLRRLVGAEVLTTEPPGYAIHGDQVDAALFEDQLDRARAAPSSEERRACLVRALHLWRGEPYSEFAHEPWAACEVRRLVELRSGAIEDLVDLELAAHEWSPAIARLQPLIEEQPFRDRPRGQLMAALSGAGRQADALRAFQQYRSYLRDEAGTEPSTPLIELDRRIASGAAITAPS